MVTEPVPAGKAGVDGSRPWQVYASRFMTLLTRERLRSHHALFWAASIVVCLTGYADVIFAHKTFVPVGYVQGTYPWYPFASGYRGRPAPRFPDLDAGADAWFVHPIAYLEHRAVASGSLPFWNRHNGLGSPLLSDGQTATLNPLHWIELANPDRTALWDIHHLLLRFAAALFTCYLLARLGSGPLVAVLGAPMASLHGSFTAMVNRADLNAYALMPALLYCVLRLRQERDWSSAVGLGAALYLVVTASHPQPAATVILSSALIAAGLAAWPRAPGVGRYLVLGTVSSILVGLVSAPYWLPFLESVRRSWSSHPPGVGLYSASPAVALQWIVPGIFSPKGVVTFLQGPFAAHSFLGGIAATVAVFGVLAPIALPGARQRLVWLSVPLLIALKLFGFPGLQWIGKLPLLSQMTFWYFGFAILYLLAVCGISAVSELTEAPPRTRLALCAAAALLVIAVLALGPVIQPHTGAVGWLSSRFRQQLTVYTLLAILPMTLAYAAATVSKSRTRKLLVASLAVALFVELRVYRYERSDRGNPTATAPYITWLQERQRSGEPFRIMGLGDWLYPNLATAFELEDVRLCDALVPPEYMAFVRRYLQKDLLWGWFLHASPHAEGFRIPDGIMNLLNVRYLISFPDGIADYISRNRVSYSGSEMQGGVVVENLHAWPRIFAIQEPHLEPSPEAALERLGTLDASSPFAVVANDFPGERWKALCASGCGSGPLQHRVSDMRYGINDLSFQVAVAGPAVLVVSDMYVEGWRAFVDGVEQPIFRVNYLFRGLILESGEHAVRFLFRPPGWVLAIWLAGVGLLACGILAVAVLAARRSRQAEGLRAVAKLAD